MSRRDDDLGAVLRRAESGLDEPRLAPLDETLSGVHARVQRRRRRRVVLRSAASIAAVVLLAFLIDLGGDDSARVQPSEVVAGGSPPPEPESRSEPVRASTEERLEQSRRVFRAGERVTRRLARLNRSHTTRVARRDHVDASEHGDWLAWTWMQRGREARDAGRTEEATRQLTRVASTFPNTTVAAAARRDLEALAGGASTLQLDEKR